MALQGNVSRATALLRLAASLAQESEACLDSPESYRRLNRAMDLTESASSNCFNATIRADGSRTHTPPRKTA